MQGVFLQGVEFAAGLAILLAASWFQFRHWGLSALAALAPLPGFAVAVFVARAAGAEISSDIAAICYLTGFAAANFMISAADMRIAEGTPAREAYAEALRVKFISIAVALALSAIASILIKPNGDALFIAATVTVTGASALLVPWLIRALPFGEDFIANTNRLRESRERGLDHLTFLVQPRWAWSVGGIALVFAAMAFFAARDSGWSLPPLSEGLLAIAVLIAGIGAIRHSRRAIAFLLTCSLLFVLLGWTSSRLPSIPPQMLLLSYALAVLPALALSAQAAAFGKAGDNASVATLRMFQRSATSVLTIVGACALALIARFDAAGIGAAVMALCGGAVALVGAPALTVALYDLFPPRISLEDAFRTR